LVRKRFVDGDPFVEGAHGDAERSFQNVGVRGRQALCGKTMPDLTVKLTNFPSLVS
jgi:hypothetical protein